MISKIKYNNITIRHSDSIGWWMILIPKDDGTTQMKHFSTQEECQKYIDEHCKQEEANSNGYWYERYLA